jgi:hypothetical protein
MDGSTEDPPIAALVMAGLASGLLWTLEADPVWIGHGLHRACIVCQRRITHHETQYDVPGPRGAWPAHATRHSVWRDLSYRMRNDL